MAHQLTPRIPAPPTPRRKALVLAALTSIAWAVFAVTVWVASCLLVTLFNLVGTVL